MSAHEPLVLVVEDEGLIGMALCDDLQTLKFDALGPLETLEDALNALQAGIFDLALVDINLRGVMSFPLLDVLTEANIPSGILTGYGENSVPERFRHLPRLEKPCSAVALSEIMLKLLRVGLDMDADDFLKNEQRPAERPTSSD